jgi:hypothetical protein
MRNVQVSDHVSGSGLLGSVETNLRIVHWNDGVIACRRVHVESADRSPDLRQKICSQLRADRIVAVPYPGRSNELLVAPPDRNVRGQAQGDGWCAKLKQDASTIRLDLQQGQDRAAAVELVQKAIVTALEHSGQYWWFSESTRYWYGYQPVATEDGIELLPRVSFATHEVRQDEIGVAIDFGHMFQTELTLADFLQDEHGVRRFNQLRKRGEGRRGTLIYDVGKHRRTKCYFNDFARDKTCNTTGVIAFGNRRYDSLFHYYKSERASLGVRADDPILYVTFEGLGRPVPVAAGLLKMRVHLDPWLLPPRMRRLSMPPAERNRRSLSVWSGTITNAVQSLGGKPSQSLWRPLNGEAEQLAAPDLLFGQGRRVNAPQAPTLKEYKRYYREREDALRRGGLYRFEQTVPKELWFVLPRATGSWSTKLQDEFLRLFRDFLQDIAGSTFRLNVTTAHDCDDIVRQLADKPPSTAVVVFDEKEFDGSAYYLLSERLQEKQEWRLKRLTRRTLEEAWRRREEARGDEARTRADGHWRDVVYHSVLDVLDQMDAVPWRIASWPYDACLAIDVSADRRYFGLSLLVCRDPQQFAGVAGFTRIVDSWPKPDVGREAINAILLEDRIAEIVEGLFRHRFPELQSLLALRDGHVCGDEGGAIDRGLNRWMRAGILSQSARIDVVDYQKRTVKDLRMWSADREATNVLEGRAVYLGENAALLCCTGAASLSPKATAEPCRLQGRRGSDIRRAAAGVFALAQHNYLSPKVAYRDAQPIRDLDRELEQRVAMEVRGMK